MSLISEHADLSEERQPGGRVQRALLRDRRLRDLIDACRCANNELQLTAEASACVHRAFRKTVQGLYFGLYERVVASDDVDVLWVRDRRATTPEEAVDEIRPPGLIDITDDPLPELTPSSWAIREPVFIVDMHRADGSGPPVKRVFRLVRDTPADWVHLQPGIFSYAFVKGEDGRAVCILHTWDTLLAAVAAPWPHRRGPVRRGKKNPLSRDNA